jgi:hypothetical protein
MANITRTVKQSIDTDGDNQNDIIFSVVPEERQQFEHPKGATYRLQVESLRASGDGRLYEAVRDTAGNEAFHDTGKTVEPGTRITLAEIAIDHPGDHGPVVSIPVSKKVKYRIVLGTATHTVELEVFAECTRQLGMREPQQQHRA